MQDIPVPLDGDAEVERLKKEHEERQKKRGATGYGVPREESTPRQSEPIPPEKLAQFPTEVVEWLNNNLNNK